MGRLAKKTIEEALGETKKTIEEALGERASWGDFSGRLAKNLLSETSEEAAQRSWEHELRPS